MCRRWRLARPAHTGVRAGSGWHLLLGWRLLVGTQRKRAKAPFPVTYTVARHGKVVAIKVRNRRLLRKLRTELELLRQVRHRTRLHERTPSQESRNLFSDTDRRELQQIVRDATHPIVEQVIASIDRDFAGIREEIMMSVVNEEAETIARDAVEAGVVDSPGVVEGSDIADSTASVVDEALATVEAELAQVVGLTDETDEVTPAIDDTEQTPESAEMPENAALPEIDATDKAAVLVKTLDTPADAEIDPANAAGIHDSPGTPDAAEPPGPEDTAESVEQGDPDAPVARDDRTAPPASEQSPPAEDPAVGNEPTTDTREAVEQACETPADSDAPYAPERAERAVADIQNGIRKLADLLSSEVNDQWRCAKNAVADIVAARVQIDQGHRAVQAILDETVRIREETAIARSEADVARREAKLFREDARRAKERADASAAAAELAANQAVKEAEAAGSCTTTAM